MGGEPRTERPLWRCPRCGRTFASRNQTHACGTHLGRAIDDHFERSDPVVRECFERLGSALAELGPVTVIPERTRIAFHTRMSFAVAIPRRRWLDGHLVLAEPVSSPAVRRVVTYSARNHVHEFRLTHAAQVDDPEFRRLLALAYAVGNQRHL